MNATLIFAGNKKIDTLQIEVPLPDIRGIAAKLATHRTGVQNEFQNFQVAWEQEYVPSLSLSAALTQETTDFMQDRLLPELPRQSQKCLRAGDAKEAFCAIWTLGATFDDRSDALIRDNLTAAFFLDVAAACVLLHFHDHLLHMLPGAFCPNKNRVIAEYYPGGELRDTGLVPYIVDRAISVGFPAERTKYGMIKPRKSQCSVILLGEQNMGSLFPKMPCGVCTGTKCTYYRLGGCHMGSGWLENAPKDG